MLIFAQILSEIVRYITMWTSRGRGRGRARFLTGDPSGNQRPGAHQSASADEHVENWESGIQTKFSVKSVTYVGSQQVAVPVTASQMDHSRVQDHDSRSHQPSGRNQEYNLNQRGAPVPKAPRGEGAPPVTHSRVFEDDDYGSDCEWDLGDNLSRPGKPKQSPPSAEATSPTAEVDLELIARNNPGVSVSWLDSILNKGPKAAKNIKGKTERQVSTEIDIFSPNIVAESRKWLSKFESSWKRCCSKMGQEMSKMIQQCFSSVYDPYKTSLYIIESTEDYTIQKGGTLSYQVAREFEKWTRQNPQAEAKLQQDGETLKVIAFYVATRFHMTSFETLVRSFKLSHAGNQFLVPHVMPFVERNHLKEACQCIAKLNLHDHFDTEEILLPLILQDKINLVESYVYQHRKQQIELLKLLDRLCDENVNLNKLADDSGVKDIKYSKLERKIIGKLAVRLMKLYQIPQDICPNVDRRRNLSAIRYFNYKFYIEESVSRETWRELVMSSVRGNQRVQELLIDEIVTANDVTEAVWWAKHFELPENILPEEVVKAMKNAEEETPLNAPEDWEKDVVANSAVYYNLQLPETSIHFVDTRTEYLAAVRYMAQTADIIGIDCEWRPSFGPDTPTRVALIQMATRDRVYLLDVICLRHALSDDDWMLLGQQIFLNSEIIKLGYGFEGDIQMLANSIPALKDPVVKVQRMIELQKLHKHVRKNPEAFKCNVRWENTLPPNSSQRFFKSDEKGLSDMVRHCLGRPLDKSEQMSDWEKRPLRVAQVFYAALDAHVLITLYEHVVERVGQHQLVMHLEPRVTGKVAPHKSRMQRKQARVAEKTEQHSDVMSAPPAPVRGPPISPSQFAVVVDTMIQGVGRYLRSCGVDVRILQAEEDHDAALHIALKENRVILTSGQPYKSLRTQVPEGMCYNVFTGDKARQQAIDILDHFNVKVTEEDIFSRCIKCNGDHYLFIEPAEMRRAWDRAMQLVQEGNFRPSLPRPMKLAARSRPARSFRVSPNDPGIICDRVNMDDVTVADGVRLQVTSIPRDVTDQVALFYCCASCGKVFWEGKHFDDICGQFSDVLKTDLGQKHESVKSEEDDSCIVFKE